MNSIEHMARVIEWDELVRDVAATTEHDVNATTMEEWVKWVQENSLETFQVIVMASQVGLIEAENALRLTQINLTLATAVVYYLTPDWSRA